MGKGGGREGEYGESERGGREYMGKESERRGEGRKEGIN